MPFLLQGQEMEMGFWLWKKVQLVNKDFMTREEAEKYMNAYHFGWAERVMRTVTEEEP